MFTSSSRFLFCSLWTILCEQDITEGSSLGGQLCPGQEVFQRVNELLQQNELIIAEIEKEQQPGTITATGEVLAKNASLLKQLNENLCNVAKLYQVLESENSRPSVKR